MSSVQMCSKDIWTEHFHSELFFRISSSRISLSQDFPQIITELFQSRSQILEVVPTLDYFSLQAFAQDVSRSASFLTGCHSDSKSFVSIFKLHFQPLSTTTAHHQRCVCVYVVSVATEQLNRKWKYTRASGDHGYTLHTILLIVHSQLPLHA